MSTLNPVTEALEELREEIDRNGYLVRGGYSFPPGLDRQTVQTRFSQNFGRDCPENVAAMWEWCAGGIGEILPGGISLQTIEETRQLSDQFVYAGLMDETSEWNQNWICPLTRFYWIDLTPPHRVRCVHDYAAPSAEETEFELPNLQSLFTEMKRLLRAGHWGWFQSHIGDGLSASDDDIDYYGLYPWV